MSCIDIHIFCLQMPYLGVVHPSCNCILICICNLESLQAISGVWVWIVYNRDFQPGVGGPLVVRDGIAGGPQHEPMLISSPLNFFLFINSLWYFTTFPS